MFGVRVEQLRAPGNRDVDQGAGLGCVHRKAEEGVTLVLGCRPTTTQRGAHPSPATPRPLVPDALREGALDDRGQASGDRCRLGGARSLHHDPHQRLRA